jgi:hypothetical protein
MAKITQASATGKKACEDARAQFGEGDLGEQERNAKGKNGIRGFGVKRGKDGKLRKGNERVTSLTVIGSEDEPAELDKRDPVRVFVPAADSAADGIPWREAV